LWVIESIESGKAIYDKINEIADFDADTLEPKNLGKIELKEVAKVWHMVA
jgi:hypothetical protein